MGAEIHLPHGYEPRYYQCPVWNHFVPDPTRKRAIVIAHRRWGKDLLAFNMTMTLTQGRVGTYWHCLPFAKQARAVVWNGLDTPSEEEERSGKQPRRFLDYVPSALITNRNENEMRLHLINGSIWQAIGADNIDQHVGTNPIGVVLSEFALMDPRVYDYIRPILRQNRGWALFITTVRGRNLAWKMLKRGEKLQREDPNWLAINSTVKDTQAISEADLDAERREGMSEQMILQEYFNSPDAPIDGAYYGSELAKAEKEGRITSVPYDPKLPVHTAWDIGYSDFTVVIFYQIAGMEVRVIDMYANSGEEMAHYANQLKERDYAYESHNGPWDVKIKQLAAGGKSVWDVAASLGIRFKVAPQPRVVADGIEQVRNIFPRLWIDKTKCERLVEALGAYRKEPLPEKLQYTGEAGERVYKDTPLHDWSSHYADAVRVMAWSIKKSKMFAEKQPQETAIDEYQYI